MRSSLVGSTLACVLELSAAVLAGQGVTELKAFHREGQTFVTWKEDGSKWYQVYAAAEPIRAAGEGELVAKIPAGSNRFGFLRNVNTSKGFFKALAAEPWCRAVQIEDHEAGAKQLADGTGLFVRTIKRPGRTYYAATGEGGAEAAFRPGVNSLDQPVAEKVSPTGAVLQRKLGDRYYLYAFFCDYELWNPDGVDDNWDGYVHVFHIRAPSPKRRDTKEPYPVSFRLHAYGAWNDWNTSYCYPATHVDVRLLDYHLTWWYGYNDALPKTLPRSGVPPKARVVNFTERRVLQVARWLAGGPKNFPFKVDRDQISVFGGSMGGTGAHYLGVRNGDVFAAAFADEGIFNWALPRKHNKWAGNVASKFGPQDRNDMTNEGVGVYDLLNLPRWAAAHPEKELPFMNIGQGMVDFVIPFHDFVNYLKALEAGKHPYAAGWEVTGHSPWARSGSPMDYRKIRRDEVVPAFANASCNSTLRSGSRIVAKWESAEGKTLTIKPGSLKSAYAIKGSFPPDLAGMSLMLGPSGKNRDVFTIASCTPTAVTVSEGDLGGYVPPLTGWDIHVLKGEIKKAEGNAREPTEQEKRAKAQAKKRTFLICDGQPRGCWSGHFAWSTRNQDFDPTQTGDDIVDSETKLAICIRLGRNGHAGEWKEDSATADVTPRRCRNFRPAAGEKVRWENWDCADPSKPRRIGQGEVAADEHGLVTVPRFQIGKAGWGNRLVLTRKSAANAGGNGDERRE